ncbi:MAG: DUF2071 domain-containing protein [Bacteroidia bacterium]|nr:DUF2071 domain-containing protein [Bacteroidia bacterium]
MAVFLTAEWRNLINLTYAVPSALLTPYLPQGLAVDTGWNGEAHVSFVAFEFLNTRLKGVRVPFHVNFPEVNLRFYVRHRGEVGVVFIRELVPRFCIAAIARRVYNEPYRAVPMAVETSLGQQGLQVTHRFTVGGRSHQVVATGTGALYTPPPESVAHYFKEHTWGYGRAHGGHTLCYQVDHPVWRAYPTVDYSLSLDFGVLYGPQWEFLNRATPIAALLAEGSPVAVHGAQRLG